MEEGIISFKLFTLAGRKSHYIYWRHTDPRSLFTKRRRIGITIIKLRWYDDRLTFIMGSPMPIRRCLLLNKGPVLWLVEWLSHCYHWNHIVCRISTMSSIHLSLYSMNMKTDHIHLGVSFGKHSFNETYQAELLSCTWVIWLDANQFRMDCVFCLFQHQGARSMTHLLSHYLAQFN